MARYNFEYLEDIYNIEIIAKGKGVRNRHYLNQKYGRGRWRKLKGRALVQYADGKIAVAEIHWFEATGIGRVEDKAIRNIEE